MIAYATVGAADMTASMAFYDAVLGVLGAKRFHSGEGFAGYQGEDGQPILWVCQPFDKQPARAGNGIMIGFRAQSRAAVDAFHAAALDAGGSSEGAPGVREGMNPVFYAAYVRDCDGNKLCAFVRK